MMKRRRRLILRTSLGHSWDPAAWVGNCCPSCVSPLTGVEAWSWRKHHAFLQGVHFHLRHPAKVNQELRKSGESKGVSRKRPLYTSPNRLFSVYFLFPCCALKVTCYLCTTHSVKSRKGILGRGMQGWGGTAGRGQGWGRWGNSTTRTAWPASLPRPAQWPSFLSVTTPPGGCPARSQTARELLAFLWPAGEVLLLGGPRWETLWRAGKVGMKLRFMLLFSECAYWVWNWGRASGLF